MTIDSEITHHAHKLGVRRLSLTVALAASLFYMLCWIGAKIPNVGPATHMYLQLFTDADLASSTALFVGVAWSIVGGLIAGGLIAAIYNALAFLDRQ